MAWNVRQWTPDGHKMASRRQSSKSMKKLKVCLDNGCILTYEIEQQDPLNAFYVDDGFLIVIIRGNRTYIPAHRVCIAKEENGPT